LRQEIRSLKKYQAYLSAVYSAVDPDDLEFVIKKIIGTRINHNRVFLCGNGGSASTAEHFSADIGFGSEIRGSGLKTMSLVSNTSVLTAISNDLEYAQVFSSRILLEAEKGDILIAFSASGNSLNVINAINAAKSLQVFTIAFVGFDGGKLISLADFSIHTKSDSGEYGIVEDVHLSLCHYMTERIRIERE
jgi:D-sedoheptulose 7-phosphate isomerase